jgi:hypothetical protein
MRKEPIQPTVAEAATPDQLHDLPAPAVENAEQVAGGILSEGLQAINAGLTLLGEAVAGAAPDAATLAVRARFGG